ncbi:uncharacterized protein LOC133795409 [Humulus lupulus]|uniref:uncharacterized protein LOC133795409 n=1 Tax=Humulus lupulus TaxID=3486 RepID=UPI002B40476F|nr:uncharacterized protein LOC133795409 [Humulus lupulus]
MAVGSGENISILGDPWLPDSAQPFVLSSHPGLQGKFVNSLMKTEEKAWDADVIKDMFTIHEQNLILNIPLFDSVTEDCWQWKGEHSGIYSVKSAYRITQELKGVVHRDNNSGFWRDLWNLKIPPKVKDLIWRAVSNCLPTRFQLSYRKITLPSSLCPRCSRYVETIPHCLVGCSFAMACWRFAGIPVVAIGDNSFGGWLQERFKDWGDDMRHMAVMVCWALWQVRNEKVWKGSNRSVKEVIALARGNFDQWRYAHDRTFIPSLLLLHPGERAEHWSVPGGNKIKINVDAAVFPDLNKFGYGWVVRDASATLLSAHTVSKVGNIDPTLAEVIGVREVLSWIKATGLTDVVVETDSLVTVQACRNEVKMQSMFGFCIDECRALVSSLHNVSLCFVKRSANRVAHHLARASCLNAGCSYSLASAPNNLIDVLLLDMA